jgi:hypothetical protein
MREEDYPSREHVRRDAASEAALAAADSQSNGEARAFLQSRVARFGLLLRH